MDYRSRMRRLSGSLYGAEHGFQQLTRVHLIIVIRCAILKDDLAQLLEPIQPFVDRTANFGFYHGRYFSACLRASFVRAFEFLAQASRYADNDSAFFLTPGLRGITEDVIYLRYMSRLSRDDREKLTMGLMFLEVHGKLEKQEAFFRVFRPFQPVLGASGVDLAKLEEEVRGVWRANGWPGLRMVIPPTRQIAERSDSGLLEVVYDFIYRLTSGMVHFNPQVLLRSGWGPTKRQTTFSTRNMDPYYLAFSRIYGGYLFCLYFEFFGRFLRPDRTTKDSITELREHLLMESRWPEMVTFEEMNIKVPKRHAVPGILIQGAYTVMFREGFIRGAKGEAPYKKWLQPTQ